MNVTPNSAAPPWHPRDREAHLLAGLLRLSRLTVLYGAAGSGKTTLLKTGVMPLLRRRVNDHALAHKGMSDVAIPFPDRRPIGNPSDRDAEVVIFLDAWSESPLARLHAKIHELLLGGGGGVSISLPLADSLAAWNKLLAVRFIIVLDRFEDYLAAPPERDGIREFGDEFVRAVNQPALPANFLISLRDDAKPLLARFSSRIGGVGNDSLRLPSLHRAVPLPAALRQEPDPPAIETVELPAHAGRLGGRKDYAFGPASGNKMPPRLDRPVPLVPVAGAAPATKADPSPVNSEALTPAAKENAATATFLFLGTVNVHDADQAATEALSAEVAAPAPIALLSEAVHKPAPAIPTRPAEIDVVTPKPPFSALDSKLLPTLLSIIAIPVAITLLVFVVWPPRQFPAEAVMPQFSEPAMTTEKPIHETASVAPMPMPVPALPRFEIVTDAGNSTDSRVARELARLVAPAAGIDLGVLTSSAWVDTLTGLDHPAAPRFAIVPYDALQAARKGNAAVGSAPTPLRLVMPLYTDEIYFIVRADSQLTFIHEIKGHRINIGLARSSAALTASRLYERMFGTRMPVTDASFLDDDRALMELVDTKTIEVMVLVAAQPADLLAHISPARARAIKLLGLDRSNPASRKALQSFLLASARAASYPSWLAHDTPTLAVMSFLVTANSTDAATIERMGAFAQSLCRNLPALRQAGHPKWREVQPGLQLDAGWPYSTPAEAGFRSCLAETQQQRSLRAGDSHSQITHVKGALK